MSKTPVIVSLGELMMRLTPPSKLRLRQTRQFDVCHGGAEANVATALSQFGLTSRFVTALPESEIGTQALREIMATGVDTRFISRNNGRMGLYFMEEGSDYRSGCVVYDRDHTAFSQLDPNDVDWDGAFDGADWFHISGITPAISADLAKMAERAVGEAHKRGVHVSIDLNFRERLWQYGAKPIDILPAMVSKANTLMAGRGDCPNCLGLDGDGENGTDEWAASLGAKLAAQFPNLSTIAITIRASTTAQQHDWRAYIQRGSESAFSRAYSLQDVVDRVGTGDAFCAGLIYGLCTGLELEAALNFGAAATSLKHSIVGDFNAVTADEVRSLAEATVFGRLRR